MLTCVLQGVQSSVAGTIAHDLRGAYIRFAYCPAGLALPVMRVAAMGISVLDPNCPPLFQCVSAQVSGSTTLLCSVVRSWRPGWPKPAIFLQSDRVRLQ